MNDPQTEEEQLIEQTLAVAKAVEALQHARGSSVSSAQIHVNAGGIGVWVAVTACLMTLSAVLVASIFVAIHLSDLNQQTRELRQQDSTLQAYINAGYVRPHSEKKQP